MRLDRPADPRRPDDAGTSLVEMLVTMGIMSVMMVVFTTAILQVYRTVSATETLNDAQNELSRAFQRFDRELRYASWISSVGTGSTWYVEFAGANPTKCNQLRLVSGPPGSDAQGVLQLLTWTLGTPPAPGTPGQTIASQIVTSGAGLAPFFTKQDYGAMPYASPTATPSGGAVGADFKSVFQRLRIQLTTMTGVGTAQIDTTFTALNTTDNTPATNGCSEGRPTP
ncbi:hypothetical protein [Actinoplanes sp. NPDC026623]|uniref:PulJ/GspJ family protein n=1 Tax=Actinoplanes sp. NPDC026623 TaxID=3155610 RepID=UPI0033D252DC